MKFNIKSKLGFTLIELLVVIGILAVLAAIAIPSVAGLIDRANVSADSTNANEMTNAIERFTSEYELYLQDIASGRLDTSNLDSAQGRVYNVTGVTDRAGIEGLEKDATAGVDTTGKAIYRDTKYPVNAETMQAVVENYMKTSSTTFTPKQSDCHYYYSPDCGLVVCTETEKSDVTDLNALVQSGKDAKGKDLSATTKWIDLTTDTSANNPSTNKTGLTTLTKKDWGTVEPLGRDIWTDGVNIYYSRQIPSTVYFEHYVLDEGVWKPTTFTGAVSFQGRYVWKDGSKIYLSCPDVSDISHYVLKNGVWKKQNWNNCPTNFQINAIWTDGTNTYYSGTNKDFNRVHYTLNNNTWVNKTWSGFTDFTGCNVWTDGSQFYCASYSKDYVLNDGKWEQKTWEGPSGLSGTGVWTDGTNIYYSYRSNQYVFNKETGNWEPKTWNGLTSFSAEDIWTDGTNYYYSNGSDQYILS